MASIGAIGGLDHRSATKLRKARVRTTQAFLRRAADRKGRRSLSRETGLAERDLLRWAHRADLMRIKGVGTEYVTLLEAAGVESIRELRRRNPRRLLDAMTDANLLGRIVRRLPTIGMVERWVGEAKDIEPIVTS